MFGSGLVTDLAVPAAVVHLDFGDEFGNPGEAGVLGLEIGADAEPEAEVAEIHAGEKGFIGDFFAGGHEAVGMDGEGVLEARRGFGDADIYELEDDPGGVRPAAFAPGAIGVLVAEDLGAPTFALGFCAFLLDLSLCAVEEVAHRLPADGGVALHEPVDGFGHRWE